MRASSLSSKEVIDLLTRYFIPVEVSSRAVRERGGAEQKEHERIQRSALQGGFNNWSVGAYVVDPDGTTLG
ncbi:MAG TPA: hypothetical protein VKJ47_09965, partial [Candidatus Binatia bacterium]|nr:hypothetical protein [Candidatus Binatia bacterium]